MAKRSPERYQAADTFGVIWATDEQRQMKRRS
jgi:hypothetical protein